MTATVITEPTDAAVQAGITTWLADKAAAGMMRTDLVFDFTGTAKLLTPLLPEGTGQLQGVRWRGGRKRGTILQWASTEPILSARGQLRNFEFADLTFASATPNAGGLYFLSSAAASNQDGRFKRCEWMGSWAYGVGLNGPATANLNSEICFDQPSLSNDASFSNAWLWSGMTPGHQQEDQFLNFSIRNSKLEGSHGCYIRFDYGGCVTIDGYASWLHTGQSNPDAKGLPQPAGTMVQLNGTGHYDGVQMFRAAGVRAELRSKDSRLIDCGWGAAGHVVWDGLSDTANAFKVGNEQTAMYRGPARVAYRDCELGGWHGVTGVAPLQVTYDSCSSKFGNPFQAGVPTGNSQLRYDTKTKPLVVAR